MTGGNKGIGRGIALRLAALGADVGITYFRHGDAANATVAELETAGVRAIARKSFFSEPGSGEPARTMEWISSELGPPAFLVSNAGTGVQRALVETKRIHWDWAVETHAVTFLEMVRDGAEPPGGCRRFKLGCDTCPADRVRTTGGRQGSAGVAGAVSRHRACAALPGERDYTWACGYGCGAAVRPQR